MNKELENKIITNYPNLFVDYSDDPYESCLTWGLVVDDGWYQLVDNLCNTIEHYLNNNPKVDKVVIIQVKEKFGTLRFYYSGGDEFIRGMVCMTELMSSKICEKCGTNQNVELISDKGWLTTSCTECLINKEDQDAD